MANGPLPIDDAAFSLARVKRFKMLLNVELADLKKPIAPLRQTPGHRISDIAAIAQDDQLDDDIVMRHEIEGQDERVWQTALIEIAIDIGGNNKVFVVLYDFRDCDRQPFADDVSLCPIPDGRFAPVVT